MTDGLFGHRGPPRTPTHPLRTATAATADPPHPPLLLTSSDTHSKRALDPGSERRPRVNGPQRTRASYAEQRVIGSELLSIFSVSRRSFGGEMADAHMRRAATDSGNFDGRSSVDG